MEKQNTTNTPKNDPAWIKAFELGFNSSTDYKAAAEFEKQLDPESAQADAFYTGKMLLEEDLKKKSIEELRNIRGSREDHELTYTR